MYRTSILFLKKWLHSEDRMPLVIRGARQVGKTWLVRHLAEVEHKTLVEINLEKTPQLADLFETNNPLEILKKLERKLNITIDPQRVILFLDEIQERPELYSKLRWFQEEMPQLPVIATGSLLEFVLGKDTMRMPVGRIRYLFLEPLSFIEFLKACNQHKLVEEIVEFSWDKEIHPLVHSEIMKYFKEYTYVGGMPKVVKSWVEKQSLEDVDSILAGLLLTYREDFRKYGGRISPIALDKVLETVPRELGKKFVYSRVDPHMRIPTIKKSLDLLCRARICHKVLSTAANGIPLGAETHEKYFKTLLLDVGLSSHTLGLTLEKYEDIHEISLINKGGIAEQVVGQLLRTIAPVHENPRLFYWLRHEKESSAELDYVIKHRSQVIPIEVKAGTSGSLKSIHLFMELKKLPLAVRIFSSPPINTMMQMKGINKEAVAYQLLSIPFYLISEIHRLIDSA